MPLCEWVWIRIHESNQIINGIQIHEAVMNLNQNPNLIIKWSMILTMYLTVELPYILYSWSILIACGLWV